MRAKNKADIRSLRLQHQYIASPMQGDPGDVVAWLGAVQAQDYLGALWAVGLRTAGATEATVERAIAERRIVRTWPMRGTLHFISPADIRWMLAHLTPRVAARFASRHRELDLDGKTFARAANVITKALEGNRRLARDAIYELLDESGVSPAGQRGIHILSYLSHDGLLCFGPRDGKQQTFVLLDEWIPESKTLEKDEALAELALRYFTSHGPATLQDFAWWTGLPAGEARSALESVKLRLTETTIADTAYWMSSGAPDPPGATDAPAAKHSAPAVHLLPAFDEYLVAYKDRSAAVEGSRAGPVNPRDSIIMSPIIVSDGRVAGTWKRAIKKSTVAVTPAPFASLGKKTEEGIAAAARRYADFLDKSIAR